MSERAFTVKAGALPPVIILTGGSGSRLQPMTFELPKSAVPIGDRSVLLHLVDGLTSVGFEHIVVNYCNAEVLDGLITRRKELHTLETSFEDMALGSAGGVFRASASLPDGDVVVVNGDTLADIDFRALLRIHRVSGAGVTLGVVGGLPIGKGTVGVTEGGRVARLRDGRYGDECSGGSYAGVLVLAAEARGRLPNTGCLIGDLCMQLCERGEARCAPVVAKFTDIGTPASYFDACMAWLRSSGRNSLVADGVIRDDSVGLQQTIIGAGAHVNGAGMLERVVVWPGAEVVAPLRNAVVTRRTIIYVYDEG